MATFKHTSTTVKRTFEVSGAPDVAKKYGSTVTIRPAQVVVEFQDGEFVRMIAKGPNVKRDGTTGNNFHEESFYPRYSETGIPDWAQPLTDPNFDGGK